jgi:GPH family glycoside/pentoside/hexuronide:cation symporter
MSDKNLVDDNPRKTRFSRFMGNFYYCLGAIPSALPYNVVGSYVAIFYQNLGLSVVSFGIIWTLYGIWNAINDPILGYYMDRKKTRWGRRKPWIVIGSIPLALGFILLWMPLTTVQWGLFAWSALYTEMYTDHKERTSIVAYKDFIAIVSSMIGVLIPPMLAANIGWMGMGIIIGLITLITMLLPVRGSFERKFYQQTETLPLGPALKATWKNKPFIIIMLVYMTMDCATGLMMMALPFHAQFVIHLEQSFWGLAAVGVIIGIIFGIPFWRWIYARKGAKEGLLISMIVFCLSIGFVFLASDFITLILFTIIPGFAFAGMAMTEMAMSAAIDYDEVLTGQRRESTLNGIGALIARLSMVFNGITLMIVQLLTGFVSGASVQPATAVIGIKLLVTLFPIIFVFIGILILTRFPLNHQKVLSMLSELRHKHGIE